MFLRNPGNLEIRSQEKAKMERIEEQEGKQEIKEQEEFQESDGLTLDELGSSWIKNPEVGGESVTFTVKKIIKLEGSAILGKDRNGKTFKKSLSGVDFGYEITTDSDEKYTVSAWEVFGKLKSIFQKIGSIKGTKVRLTHLLDGMKPENKGKDCYKVEAFVNDSWKVLDRETKEWK